MADLFLEFIFSWIVSKLKNRTFLNTYLNSLWDCRLNFKLLYIYRKTFPIPNCTLKSFVWSRSI